MWKRMFCRGWIVVLLVIIASPAWSEDTASQTREVSSATDGDEQAVPAEGLVEQDGVSQSVSAVLEGGAAAQSAEGGYQSAPSPPPPVVPPKPWKGLYFDNDFSYKRDPNHTYLLGEELKDVPLPFLGEHGWISYGGELRFRHMNENNRLRPGGPGRSTYDLWRWRNYLDVGYSDLVRGYVEMIDASIFNQELPITPIDKNRWDILNAFVDLLVTDLGEQSVYFRFGRQELLYGAQRLVSPLDWSNTRRNFEGFKLFSHGWVWDIDAWATHPVNTATGNGPFSEFDNGRDKADTSRYFSGVYATYRGMEQNLFDVYWLWDRESDAGGTGADYSRQTVGMRWTYDRPVHNGCCDVIRVWHAEVEGGYQFGHDDGETVKSGFITLGAGHTWKTLPWTPTFWLYYDWASGDDDPADGDNNTFLQLFPLGHKYLGIIDNVARQNISDINIKLAAKPAKKLTVVGQYHWMDLESDADVLYNIAGVGLGAAGTGAKIGEELDIVANYAFHPNFGVQLGYSWFFYGSFVTEGALVRGDASQFYLQSTLRY